MTYYDVLGISPGAKDADLKKAYRQMIIAFHPDTYQGDKQFADRKTREIIRAYQVLSNPEARTAYNAQLDEAWQQHFGKAERRRRRVSILSWFDNLTVGQKALIVASTIGAILTVTLFLMVILTVATSR